MRLLPAHYPRIKNLPGFTIEKDFTFNTFSFFLLILTCAAALGVYFGTDPGAEPLAAPRIALVVAAAGAVMALLPIWSVLILTLIGTLGALAAWVRLDRPEIYVIVVAGVFLASSVQLLLHWEKAVILRLGKFRRVRGAGLYLLLPGVDRVADKVDTRIKVTDFSAEKTLTRDNVPVHVDAICFWLIWDAKKAILEVENYTEAVTLSAQTSLREAIGSHDLSQLLSERDEVGSKLQKILDAKTNPWGISILSVEFTDIIIPKELEDAISRKAQAERERQARLILGEAEAQVAHEFAKAAEIYREQPAALNLRAMNMVYDSVKQSKGSIMLVPSSAIDQMNLGSVLGTAALGRLDARAGAGDTGDEKQGGEA